MKKKTSKVNRVLDFFAGKGFYVVLFVCVTAIGVSGYALLFASRPADPISLNPESVETLSQPDWDIPTMTPVFDPYDDSLDVWGSDAIPVFSGTSPAVAPPSVPPSSNPSAATGTSPNPSPDKTTATSPSPSPDKAAATSPKPSTAPTFVWPVNGSVLTPHSEDELIYDKTMGDWRVHMGLDIETAAGAKVCAIADGTVKEILDDPNLGTTVIIEHEGKLVSQYSNLSSIPTVKAGDKVKKGEVIGATGNTALDESALTYHLHLEVFNDGSPVDPAGLLPQK